MTPRKVERARDTEDVIDCVRVFLARRGNGTLTIEKTDAGTFVAVGAKVREEDREADA